MYYYIDIEQNNETIRHIFKYLPDGGVQSFPDTESNNGPERKIYLSWVEQGNTPELWNK